MSDDSSTIKVFIVEDHPLFVEGLIMKLDRVTNIDVCGTASSVDEALVKIKKLKPEIVITDISLKEGKSGIELINILKKEKPEIRVITLTMHEELHFAERAIRAGAWGYVTKNESPDTIIKAINNVINDTIYLDERINSKIVSRIMHNQNETITDPVQTLTDREFEIFQLIGKGLNSQEIANQLGLSKSTIDVNRKNIREKLKVENNSGLIRYAYEWITNN